MFALNEIDPETKVSYRETLQGLLDRARTDERRVELEAELAVLPLPRELDYLWRAFWRLAGRRQSTGFGPARISWMEIDAFVRLSGVRFTPWEIELIEELDDLYLAGNSREKGADQG